MNLVKYSLNGIYFDFYGVYVSDSIGIADGLERKPVQSYDWAEYHGISVDLVKPKYKERKIELKCFIDGDNWQDLFVSFKDFVLKEFSKSGTQRLIIEPFGDSPLVYDVFMQDGIKLEKRFNKGKMIGTFSLMLTEPNPIKKVLYTVNPQLTISYNSPTETDIIIDGAIYQGKEVVNFTKNLIPRTIVSNDTYRRNLLVGKLFLTGSDYQMVTTRDPGKITVLSNKTFNAYQFAAPPVKGKAGDKYSFSVEIKFSQVFEELKISLAAEYPENYAIKDLKSLSVGVWHKLTMTSGPLVNPTLSQLIIIDGKGSLGSTIEYRNGKLEIGNNSSEWSPAPEDQHYINIAGNVEDITNFTTNAEVLWEKI